MSIATFTQRNTTMDTEEMAVLDVLGCSTLKAMIEHVSNGHAHDPIIVVVVAMLMALACAMHVLNRCRYMQLRRSAHG